MRITKVNTSGFYAIPNEPDNNIGVDNNVQGSFLAWGAARLWTFDSVGVCAKYSDYQDRPNEILAAFKILETARKGH